MRAEWNELKGASLITPKRSGHVSFSTDDGRLLVFGGYAEENPGKRYVVNDLWEWKDEGWYKIEAGGELPGPRLVSATGLAGTFGARTPYLFGGWDPQIAGSGGTDLSTVHSFKGEENEFVHESAELPSGPTSRHVCLSLPSGKVLLHDKLCDGRVILFDGSVFVEQVTTGCAPSSRGLHVGTVLSERHVLFFGGAVIGGGMSNECFILNVDTWAWNLLAIEEGPTPSPRAAPCMCRFSDSCAIVFGGASAGLAPEGDVWALEVDADNGKGKWELLSSGGPPPRNAATLDLIAGDDSSPKEYVLTGGWAPFAETFSDSFVLKVSTQ